MRTHLAVACLAAIGIGATTVSAQVTRGVHTPVVEVARSIQQGDEAHTGLRPLDALELYRSALDIDPDSYPVLWRASREALALGALASSEGDREAWYARAVDYAHRAVATHPDGVEGQSFLTRSLWAAAEDRSTRVRVRDAPEILEAAHRTLDLDPSDAAAHAVLGAWNADVMRLSALTRWAARNLTGHEAIEAASWKAAEEHLRLAVSSEPTGLAHHFALGRMLLDSGHPDEARECLREVLDRPSAEPIDPMLKQRAQDLLGRIGRT